MRLKVTQRFNDLQADKVREKDDCFETDEARADELIKRGFVKSEVPKPTLIKTEETKVKTS